jgi:hypothetical protein
VADRKALVEISGFKQVPDTDRVSVGAGVAFADPAAKIDASGGVLTLQDASGTKSLDKIPIAGTGEIDFGAFPGANTSSVFIPDPTIEAGSIVDAKIVAKATVDHSADEHIADAPDLFAGSVVAAAGFWVYGSFTKNLGPTTYGKWAFMWTRT